MRRVHDDENFRRWREKSLCVAVALIGDYPPLLAHIIAREGIVSRQIVRMDPNTRGSLA
jgi:hypothetical protein